MNLARNIKNNPKLFWKYTKSRLISRQEIPSLTKPNGEKATTDKDKAETLNAFFASVFTIEEKDTIPPVDYTTTIKTLSTIEITPEVVLEKLLKLDPNKSQGHDMMHPYVLKELAHSLALPLSILFNKSLKEGAHDSWRKAIIKALHKKG